MTPHKRTCAGVVLAIALAAQSVAAGANTPPAPKLPEFSPAQRLFLSRVARRTILDVTLGQPAYRPGYVPASLNAIEAAVVVRLRLGGYLLAHAAAGPKPIAIAVRDASLAIGRTVAGDASAGADLVARSLIEIEVIGPSERLNISGDWTQPGVVDPLVEPGVHGLAFAGPTVHHSFCPTELYTTGLVLPDALRRFAETSQLDPSSLSDVRLARFRTVHWYQDQNARIVALQRGLTLVPDEAVSPPGLDEAIDSIAAYMIYRQRASGLFAYEYEAGHDRYGTNDNLTRQAGAAMALAMYAKRSGLGAAGAAADVAIRRHLTRLTASADVNGASFIATPDGQNPLGATALLSLAMAEHPNADRYRETREKLVVGMLWLQRPSGMFLTAFPPAASLRGQDYFPGTALLALATEYADHPTAKLLDAFDRAVSFYRGYFRETPTPRFVSAQVQAFSMMARLSKRADFRDFVFELTDWLAAKQLDESNCDWPELLGGIAARHAGRVDISTASYLEAFADALALARSTGDTDRAARYKKTVRAAARFVMQLQVRPEEAYFVPGARDFVGGVRAGPALNSLRIDHCQHALIALMKTRDVLYPDQE